MLSTFNADELEIVAKYEKLNTAGRNYGGEKEMLHAASILGMVHGHIAELAMCRWYMGRSKNANIVYASVWFNVYGSPQEDGSVYTSHVYSGTGRCGGYGCELRGAAMGNALKSAGFTLKLRNTDSYHYTLDDGDVYRAIEGVKACCVALGYTEKLCHIVHG